jgi:hypothetical protein
MNKNNWLVGNSHLYLSILKEYCKDDFVKFGEDWKNERVSKGEFSAEQYKFNFLFCNMSLLGSISFDGQNVNHTNKMGEFVNLIDQNPSVIVVMLRGNEFAYESIVETPVPWDFTYKNDLASKGRQALKTQDVLEHLDRVTNATLATCLLYRISFPKAKVFYVAPPPPIESEVHISKESEGFGPLIEKFGIRPFQIRKKIYHAMYDQLTTKLENYEVKTLPPPNEALTDSGGLRTEYASGCLHGNNLYGRSLVKMMVLEGIYAPL